jgi:transposase
MTKHSIKKKLKAIEEIEAGDSIGRVAIKYGIDRRDMSYLWRLYQEHGLEGITKYKSNWTAEQKFEILKYMQENGLSGRETGIKFGIGGHITVKQWEHRYLENGMNGLEEKNKDRKPRERKPKPPKTREEELLGRIEYLEAENAYLKKLNALVAEREKRERENK